MSRKSYQTRRAVIGEEIEEEEGYELRGPEGEWVELGSVARCYDAMSTGALGILNETKPHSTQVNISRKKTRVSESTAEFTTSLQALASARQTRHAAREYQLWPYKRQCQVEWLPMAALRTAQLGMRSLCCELHRNLS